MNYSYSRLSMFDRCPKKFEYRYITKFEIPDKDNVIFERGKFLHALIEQYPALPEFEFKYKENIDMKMEYISLISNLCRNDKKMKYLLSPEVLYSKEQQFYLDAMMCNCDEENQLVNGIIDYVGLTDKYVILCDWKSGRTQKYASFDQLKFYCIWAFNNFPHINTVKAFLYFIEQNIYVYEEIDRADVWNIKNKYLKKIDIIESTTDFKKIIKEDCQYCDYRHDCQPFKVRRK